MAESAVHCILGPVFVIAERIAVVRRRRDLRAQRQVSGSSASGQLADAAMGGLDFADHAVLLEHQPIDADLAMHAVGLHRNVVTVVDNVVIITVFQDRMMSRPVDRLVGIRREDRVLDRLGFASRLRRLR